MDPAGAAAACALWRDDVQVRASWHAYHLIGDVLRSEDLAIEPSRDAAFLAAVRDRLSREAVVLAPVPAAARAVKNGRAFHLNDRAAAPSRRWPWVVSTAVAAGFVGVTGTLTVSRQAGQVPAQAPTLASVGSPTQVVTARADAGSAAMASAPAPARVLALDESGVVRDPTLDAYLAAHKQFAGSTALGVPSAFLRSATVRSSGR